MLNVRGRPMLDWALESLHAYINAQWEFSFVCLEDRDTAQFVEQRARALGIKLASIVTTPAVTSGQAETAKLAIDELTGINGLPLVIYNVDTHVRPGVMNPSDGNADGWVPCFPGEGLAWSFARTESDDRIVEIAEKVRISDWATVGLYGFRSASVFLNAYDALYGPSVKRAHKETYIAPMYQSMIDVGLLVRMSQLNLEDVVPLGTPEEVKRIDKSFKPPGVRSIY